MVNEFTKHAKEAGFADKMSARKGDLLAENLSEDLNSPDLFDFDLVVISMALHHFEDPTLALRRLGERLKKGGSCYIIDNIPDHHHNKFFEEFAEAKKMVKSHGFSKDELWKLLKETGFTDGFEYDVIQEPLHFTKDGKSFQTTIFIAKARKA